MRRLFVVMPFGRKPADPQHGVDNIDFDLVYRQVIRSAADTNGWSVRRIDEVKQAGSIEHQFLREIFEADLMVADVSLPNANVFFELGVRQAVSTAGTILIAHRGSQLPFDIRNQRVIFYDLSEEGIATAVSDLIASIGSDQTHGPNAVREYLDGIGFSTNAGEDPVRFQRDLQGRIERASTLEQLIAVWHWAKPCSPLPANGLMLLATNLGDRGGWTVSSEILRRAAELYPGDFEVQRLLGWHLSKTGRAADAHAAFEKALALNPNDPETLGMRGGLFKRQGKFKEAAGCYAKGAKIAPESLYMRVNAAALVIMGTPKEPGAGIQLYRILLDDLDRDAVLRSDPWADLVLAESNFAIGDSDQARACYLAALRKATPSAMRSALDQLHLFGSTGFRQAQASALVEWLEAEIGSRAAGGAPAVAAGESTAPAAQRPRRRIIVHLSDVHFGSREKNGQRVDMHRFREGPWAELLSTHVVRELSETSVMACKPDEIALVISGDLTYGASREEFKLVHTFLSEVCSGLHLSKERVVLAPGNHDVHWPSAVIDRTTRFDNYFSFLSNFYGEALFRQIYPRLRWDEKVDSERDPVHNFVGAMIIDDVLYVSLNSCVYETEQNHYGFIGRRQLELVDELIKQIGGDVLSRVAVLHHHLHPFPEMLDSTRETAEVWMDLSTVRDAGLVERRLEKMAFDVVLHGHKHKPQLRETSVRDRNEWLTTASRLIVCGAGSTGVNSLELGGERNHYAMIELLAKRQPGAEFLNVQWRELPVEGDPKWLTSVRWTIQG